VVAMEQTRVGLLATLDRLMSEWETLEQEIERSA
jgi:hypothetical protein